jgi:hypothetical protein
MNEPNKVRYSNFPNLKKMFGHPPPIEEQGLKKMDCKNFGKKYTAIDFERKHR